MAAVCIIRIERQAEHLVFSVRTVRNLNHNLYSARSEIPIRCSTTDEALQVASTFLRSLEHDFARPVS